MGAGRPHAWEKSYPEGLRWDTPIGTSTLQELLDRAAAYGERTALEYRERRVTFRELHAQAERAAAAFLNLGIDRDCAVALLLPNTPWHPVAFFGALRTGARVVHLSPLDAERELIHKLHDSGARTIVTTNLSGLDSLALKLAAAGHVDRVIVGDDRAWSPSPGASSRAPGETGAIALEVLMATSPTPTVWPSVSAEDIALLQYTGATTGVPKAAVLTHANLTAAVSSYRIWVEAQRPPSATPDRVIMVLPLFHIYGLTAVMLRHLASGNELMLRPRFEIEAVLRDIEVNRATLFPGVPTMWIALLSHPGIERCDLSSLRSCNSGGAPLPVEVAERFHRLTGLPLPSGWGMTEASPAGTSVPLDGPSKPGTIGVPLPGIVVEVVALDDPRRVLVPGEIGELKIKGANVMQRYWNRPAETQAAFADGFFLSGDIGTMDEDGYFFILDRKKDMIISGGFNVYPQVIENAIYEHPDVEEVLVIGVADPYRGEAAKAFVKLRSGAPDLTLAALRDFLADKIGRQEMPAALEIRANLPRTSVGKLSKKELLDEERQRPPNASAPTAPALRERA
ncbi:MAG: dicarboxylate--CoA ligase PimA [Xanthobacteraceae bacterium]